MKIPSKRQECHHSHLFNLAYMPLFTTLPLMADLRLFKLKQGTATAKVPTFLKLEKHLQKICEDNLETFFGIRFLASEYSTGDKHGGRIDSLGIDENNCPVIIEYKLNSNENVINQGLFYLDWLMDHKAAFEKLCQSKLGKTEVEWSSPRLLCIARDFTKYDGYAINQIDRNIELIRYRHFEGDMIVFELAEKTAKQSIKKTTNAKKSLNTTDKNIETKIEESSSKIKDILSVIDDFCMDLGDDVQKKYLKYYMAYSRIKNFMCLKVYPTKNLVRMFIKVKFSDIKNPPKFVRNVSHIGHHGTGDTEIDIKTTDQFEEVKYLLEQSYNEG